MFFSWCDWQINYDLLNFNFFGRPVFSHLGEILNAVRSCFTWAHVKKEFFFYLYTKIFNATSGRHQHIFKIRLQYRRTWFSSRIPADIRLDEDVLKTSFVFVFGRRLEDVLIKTNMFASALRLQKTSSRRLGQDQYIRLGHTSSRRLQDVFKTSSRHLAKTSSRYLQDVFKTFWGRLQYVLQKYFQDVFKTYHQVKLSLLTRLLASG